MHHAHEVVHLRSFLHVRLLRFSLVQLQVREALLWCTCQLSMSLCLNSKQQQQQGAKPGTGQFAQSLANLRPGTGQSAQSLVYLGPGTGQSAQSLSDLGPGTGQFAQSLANLGPGTGQFAQSLVSVDFARGGAAQFTSVSQPNVSMISQVLLARDMFVYFSFLEGPVSVFAALEGARSKRC